MTMGQLLFNIEEAATFLNVKVSRLRMAVFRKEISYIKLGGLLRFTKEHLEEWILKGEIKHQ